MNVALEGKEYALEDPDEVMREYKRTGDITLRNQLVLHYAPYVNAAIYSMRSMLLSNIPPEDFFNQGILALIERIERFDPDRGVKFDTYIYKGIRGSIVNYVRKQNWLPNRIWTMSKRIRQAQMELEGKLMRRPTQQEIAAELEMSVEELEKLQTEIYAADSVSYEELIEQSSEINLTGAHLVQNEDMDARLVNEEILAELEKAIQQLPPRYKQVIALCYYEKLNLREIGEVLGLTQQRVSQIRAKALEKLQAALKKYEEG